MSSTLEHDPRVAEQRGTLAGLVSSYRQRVRQGDIGQLPVIVGLIVIWAIFAQASDGKFLTSYNLVNLTLQMAAVGTIAVGIVLVLLLGEIDLSAGVVSGMCAAVMAVLVTQHDVPAPLAVLAGLASGALVGALHGLWITRFGIPSFVVTLAGLIAWQGLLLRVLGRTGTVNLRDPFVLGLAGKFFTGAAAYLLGAALLVYVVVLPMLEQRRRARSGLSAQPMLFLTLRGAALASLVFGAIEILCRDRGISTSLLYLVGLIILMDLVLRRTRPGRMIFAIGGNAEAARRAGIPVRRMRMLVFALASTMAAWGGILGASRLMAVNQSAGQGDVLLNAIAAAVIGGTSLFGGRGSVWAALLGIAVIQSISNGMDLLSLQPSIKFMITGGVLLTAVTLDSLLRRGNTAAR